MSKVQVDTIDTRSGTSTMQIGSTNTSTINIGVSGDTVNIPSGVTIANAGTATGFGGDGTPKFYVKKNADQTGITDNAVTKVTFETEEIDSDSAFASNKFTVPSGEGGTYFIGFNFIGARPNQTKNARGLIYKNGSAINTGQLDFNSSPNGYAITIHLTRIIELSASDYIEFYGAADSQDGNTVTFYQSNTSGDACYAYGYKIG